MATLSYYTERRLGLILLTQPALTQTLGPCLQPDDARAISQQQDLMQTLVERLPRFHHYAQNWHYNQSICLLLF